MKYAVATMMFLCLLAGPALAGPKEELMAADRAFAALSVEKGQAAADLATIADDVRLFGGGGEPIIGRAAAEAFYASDKFRNSARARGTLNWEPVEAFASADGSMGWTDGHWTFDGAADETGARAHSTGHYVTIWRRDTKGVWKVVGDIGTSDPPPKPQ